MEKRAAVIVNPAARREQAGSVFQKFRKILEDSPLKFKVFFTEYPQHATLLSRKMAPENDLVIAFGGDGTVNEVAQGLIGTSTPLAVLPCGTGNDFARSLKIKKLKQALKTIINYNVKQIDVGSINGKLFINGVGIGFDGYVNKLADEIRFLKNNLVYYYSIIKGLITYRSLNLTFRVKKAIHRIPTYLIASGNGSFIGGGLKLTPSAVLDDGLLDFCLIEDVPRWKIILNLGRLKTGTIDKVREVRSFRSREIQVQGENHLPIHVDGEVFREKTNQVLIRVYSRALRVIGNWS